MKYFILNVFIVLLSFNSQADELKKCDLIESALTKGEHWIHSSDYAAFYDKKNPFVYFDFTDHEDYHELTDDFENID